jgi:hypothetical protein
MGKKRQIFLSFFKLEHQIFDISAPHLSLHHLTPAVEHPHVTTSSSFQCVVVPGGHRRLASASPTPRSSPDRRWQQEQMATSVPLRTLSPASADATSPLRWSCDWISNTDPAMEVGAWAVVPD